MQIDKVMGEIGDALNTIDGLNVFSFSAMQVKCPAAIVGFPTRLEYDVTYTRGCDRITIPVTVVFGQVVNAKETTAILAKYASGKNSSTAVKYALEGFQWTSCNSVRVTEMQFDAVDISGQDYIAAQFELDVIGRGDE